MLFDLLRVPVEGSFVLRVEIVYLYFIIDLLLALPFVLMLRIIYILTEY